ncbi:hypothetical protein BGZ76_008083 [Entomortierella beljakovae]|nr:hypothetical protein BGZ76_008083 [Entomortierella beljakovae]
MTQVKQVDPNEELYQKAYSEIIDDPLSENYEENWDEEAYWKAIEAFKARVKEIGDKDALDVLKGWRLNSYEILRDSLKEGPPKCFRKGWKSGFIGEKVDMLSVLQELEHLSGPKYTGVERIVLVDFWATWCKPCIMSASGLSELNEKYPGQVTVIGVNNEKVFGGDVYDVEKSRTFLEEHKSEFRYTNYSDPKHHAKKAIFAKCEFIAIPCGIMFVDNVVTFVGSPEGEPFETTLKEALELIGTVKEE